MNLYEVYGHTLQSEIEFPDLSPGTSSSVRWSVRVGAGSPPALTTKEPIGGFELAPGWELVLEKSGRSTFRLTVGPAGVFDLRRVSEESGYQIIWYPGDGAPEWFIRSVVLGPMMALALHDSGVLCLHGSAVTINGRVLAFIAPKHHGKSTLSLSLLSHGALLVADDLVAVELGPPIRVLPGVPSIRLLKDSFERFNGHIKAEIIAGPKTTLAALPENVLARGPSPLGAIYVLNPDEGGRETERTPLRFAEAVAEVALRTSLRDSLVGAEMSAKKLQRVAQVVTNVPVYRLRFARDYDHLSALTKFLIDSHGSWNGVAASMAATSASSP